MSSAPLLPRAPPLLTLALVLSAGVALGLLAKRLRLPSVTGQILAGVLIGPFVLHIVDDRAIHSLQPITHFALGLIAVSVGAHLNVRRLRNAGRRLSVLLLAEMVVTPILVVAALSPSGLQLRWMLLLGAIAVATAPVTVIAIIKEGRAKGVFVKTLLAAVALNNVGCILLFEVARAAVKSVIDPSTGALHASLLAPGRQLLLAIALGAGAAVLMIPVVRLVTRQDLLTTASTVAIVLVASLSDYLGVSPLLSCLVLGMVQSNLIADRAKLADSVFVRFEPVIFAVFFTLAGMHLDFVALTGAGIAAVAFIVARGAGKILVGRIAMRVAAAPDRVQRYLGYALLPQAGVAIGLVIMLADDPVLSRHAAEIDRLVAIVLAAVTANEIIGPILTRHALARAGEVGRDRSRLIDFLQEENIVTNFRAASKEAAIAKLAGILVTSHHLEGVDRAAFLKSVLDREAEASTCFGGGLAVPHGILPGRAPMVGVMAISREGLDFEAPDGRPVHCMVLLATSEAERDRHLLVLAALARTVGLDTAFQERLFNAKSAAHAYEILHGEHSEDFNTYLEES